MADIQISNILNVTQIYFSEEKTVIRCLKKWMAKKDMINSISRNITEK